MSDPSQLSDLFASPGTLALGAIAGLIFGFLLQKGGVTRFDTIVGQLLLRDFTMLKVVLTAIVVGGIGVFGMRAAGMDVALHIKGTAILANLLGGGIFGIGMAVLGYCPGTGIAAIGDGARDAVPGLLGMLTGAALYAEAYPWFKAHVLPVGDLGKVTLDGITGISPWLFFAALVGLVALSRLAPSKGNHRKLVPAT